MPNVAPPIRYDPLQPIAYVAGAYRNNSEWQVVQNIRLAESAALALWGIGFAVICPHKNTALLGGSLPDSIWLSGDLAILSRCDMLFALENAAKSSGATDEITFAKANGIAVVRSLMDAKQWLNSRRQNQKSCTFDPQS